MKTNQQSNGSSLDLTVGPAQYDVSDSEAQFNAALKLALIEAERQQLNNIDAMLLNDEEYAKGGFAGESKVSHFLDACKNRLTELKNSENI